MSGNRLTRKSVNNRLKGRNIEMLSPYLGKEYKATFRCQCGFRWEAFVSKVLQKTGCPSCASRGFNKNTSAILYYLRVVHPVLGVFYKVGVTNRTVEQRFQSWDLSLITVINTVRYKHGADALNAERFVLENYKEFKHSGEKVLSSGNTELFTKDVLGLDSIDQGG